MALTKPSNYSRTTPSGPKLSLETASYSGGQEKLIIQEDLEAARYQIRSLGGNASASVQSLGHWRPVDLVPTQLIDAQCPPSPESAVILQPARSDPAPHKRIAKFAAWVKRSGKGLVLRLRRQKDTSVVDFTDIHFQHRAFDDTPYDVLCELDNQAQIHELTAPHRPWAQEIDSRSRAELGRDNSCHELPDDPSMSPTSTELPGSEVPELASPQQENLRSPSDTITTTFSAADTAVDSAGSESGGDMEILTLASRPVATNLSITKSIRYRCATHQDFEPASPKDIVRLTSDPSPLATLRRDAAKHKASMQQSTIRPLGDALEAFDAAEEPTGGNCLLHDGVANILKPEPNGVAFTPCTEEPPLQAMYGMSMSTCVYKQDLYVTEALVQARSYTTHHASLSSLTSQNADHVQTLLQNVSPLGELFAHKSGGKSGINVKDALKSAISRTEKYRESSTSPGNGLRTIGFPLAAKPPLPTECSARFEADTAAQASTELSDTMHDQHNIISPLSPISDEDKRRRGSQASLFVPVTPLTPEQTFKPDRPRPQEENSPPARRSEELTETTNHAAVQPLDNLESALPDEIENADGEVKKTALSGTSDAQGAAKQSEVLAQGRTTINHPSDFGVRHLADLVEYQHSPAPVEVPIPPLGFLFDDKIPAQYKNTRFKTNLQIDTTVPERSPPQVVPSEPSSAETSEYDLVNTGRAQPDDAGALRDVRAILVSGVTTAIVRSALWLQRHAGQEPPVPAGHVRVRWTCICGEKLFDDFRELRPGAATRLEALLNKETPHPYNTPNSGARGSQSSLSRTPGSSGHPSSSATSWSNGSAGYGPPSGYYTKGTPRSSRTPSYQMFPPPPKLFLLTCTYEGRNTPKAFNVPLHELPVETDSQLADTLRDRYRKVNAPWYRWLRLRGLTSIDLVQFYMHKNRFADIYKRDSLPEGPQARGYEFDPLPDLLPPVGGQYLVHLFKHPHEYDGERLAYSSVPKRNERLEHGIGWGIILTEGFLPERIWLLVFFTLILFACVFGTVWAVKKDDVQGAFGVASFVTTLASVMVGFAQACQG